MAEVEYQKQTFCQRNSTFTFLLHIHFFCIEYLPVEGFLEVSKIK